MLVSAKKKEKVKLQKFALTHKQVEIIRDQLQLLDEDMDEWQEYPDNFPDEQEGLTDEIKEVQKLVLMFGGSIDS